MASSSDLSYAQRPGTGWSRTHLQEDTYFKGKLHMCASTLGTSALGNKAQEYNAPTSPDCKDNGDAAINLDSGGCSGVCDAGKPTLQQ